MNEDNLWDWLRNVVLPVGKYSRIESPDTAPGFPDVHFQVGKEGCGTFELKATDRNLRVPFPDEEKGLHRSQLKWIRDTFNEGGVVLIIAETPTAIYIIHGKDAARFNGATHEDLIDMAYGTLSRDEPKEAAEMLDSTLKDMPHYHGFAEYWKTNHDWSIAHDDA